MVGVNMETNRENSKELLLVVDDDQEIRDLLAAYLERHNFLVHKAANGEEMFALLPQHVYSLVVLDIMLPGEDGRALGRKLRSFSKVPLIFLTALGESQDKVTGLELGADDYIVKPFQPRELLARIRAVLRRSEPREESATVPQNASTIYSFNGWELHLTERHLRDPDSVIVNLSGAEFRLLRLFLEHPTEVLSRDFLQEAPSMGLIDRSPFDRSLDVQICRLRSKLKDNGREARLIKTVRGDGYVFSADVTTY